MQQKKEFKELWEQKEKLYRASGMIDEQISDLKEYDESAFKLDRSFYRK